mmetsp:Transcript_48407/g.122069  ORF Transcript_48407/g.122069 Transcript_48407/m.122069 type:complete len:262 (-) Transcript_48407:1024-1809(-)
MRGSSDCVLGSGKLLDTGSMEYGESSNNESSPAARRLHSPMAFRCIPTATLWFSSQDTSGCKPSARVAPMLSVAPPPHPLPRCPKGMTTGGVPRGVEDGAALDAADVSAGAEIMRCGMSDGMSYSVPKGLAPCDLSSTARGLLRPLDGNPVSLNAHSCSDFCSLRPCPIHPRVSFFRAVRVVEPSKPSTLGVLIGEVASSTTGRSLSSAQGGITRATFLFFGLLGPFSPLERNSMSATRIATSGMSFTELMTPSGLEDIPR